jgi:uncharacterized protein (TIGR02597 family)
MPTLRSNSTLNQLQAVIKNIIMSPSTKSALRLAAGILLTSVASTLAQTTTATTDPVGFITLNVAAANGANPSLSFKGLGLTRAVEYQGSAETVGTNTLTDNEATWADNQFNGANGSHFVEIVSGPGAGTTYDISATSAANKRITLAQNLAGNISAPVTFKIRKHWTIASVFGAANESGLASGDEASVADQILLHDPGAYRTYYYQVAPPAAGGTGWRNANNVFADAGSTVLYPDEGVIIRRTVASPVNVVLLGAVKIGQCSIPIVSGINILGNTYAAPITLQSSLLFTGNSTTGLVSGDEASTSDQVLLWNGTGYSTFYYQTAPPAAGGTGWRSSSNVFADAGGTSIPVGSALIVKRTNGAAFDWKAPQHPASL